MKFKVGDKVRVRDDLVGEQSYDDDVYFAIEMKNYNGRQAVITTIQNNCYYIDIDNGCWMWSDSMLEPVNNEELTIKSFEKKLDKIMAESVRAIQEVKKEFDQYVKNQEEVNFEEERQKVLSEMKAFSYKPDWKNHTFDKFVILYDHMAEKIIVNSRSCVDAGIFCFESKEQAQKCIYSIGEDRLKKYYFRVKK